MKAEKSVDRIGQLNYKKRTLLAKLHQLELSIFKLLHEIDKPHQTVTLLSILLLLVILSLQFPRDIDCAKYEALLADALTEELSTSLGLVDTRGRELLALLSHSKSPSSGEH